MRLRPAWATEKNPTSKQTETTVINQSINVGLVTRVHSYTHIHRYKDKRLFF